MLSDPPNFGAQRTLLGGEVSRCGWEMCSGEMLLAWSLPIWGPRHKRLSVATGSKMFSLHLRVELRSHQWVAKLNSCLRFKLEWKSLGQCPKSSWFCLLRQRGLFLGTKPLLVNIDQGSGWLQRWMNRFGFPVTRKQQQRNSQKPVAWIWKSGLNHYTA